MSKQAMKQEFFSVVADKRKNVVRQDRTPFEPGLCHITVNGFRCDVLNLSTFGCAILVAETDYAAFRAAFGIHNHPEAALTYKDIKTQNIKLRWVRNEPYALSPFSQMLVAFEVMEEPLQIERIQALQATTTVIEKQTEYAVALSQLPAEFKNYVYEMKDWLEKLKAQVDTLEANAPKDSIEECQEYKATIATQLSQYLGHVIPGSYAKIPELIKDLSPEQLKWATEFAREQVGHLIYGAPFASRAYYKPRGYAGDYEMMNHLYRNELVGKTLFDQCMHKYFIDEPAGAAVKNRGTYLFEKISALVQASPTDKPLKFLSIASGPAMEQQLFLKNKKEFYGRTLEFTCLDQDEESLKHAQRRLLTLERSVKSGFNYRFNNMAIKNVIAMGCPEQDYDMIYSAGLFDYFTEHVAHMAAKQMLNSVKDGGHIIIGNFSKTNPCVPFMELILDWHLIYRSEEDLLRIFNGLGSKIWIEKEPLGVNLFVVIKK
ncbi:class I SAM-dependent methyltransferase [Bdellovibrio sp. KM01]|uniref:class I SAM-dependent methyltransferase n=1 Tax=Bdellovibrio sp. KM01 TaxID=2748865 RepID=UPI0015E9BA87|nr:class I SAM-dependent methyltransferase [Bdellovibrio sp. KM01]QLY26459.1 class I SAM-dependent methyltransferase [Bdellovibrio sp. KM01]